MAIELYWAIEDEASACEYRVRVHYRVEPYESGDDRTPPHGGEVHLEGLDVAQVRHFDADGNIASVEIGKAAERHTAAAWRVLQEDEFLRERIDEACRKQGYQGLSQRSVLDGSL